MEEIIGKSKADDLALIEFFELEEELERISKSAHPEDAHLFLNLEGRDPDDGMTDVAYVKGAFFLKTLENRVGRDKMDVFLQSYFNFKFTSVNTEKFVAYLEKELLKKYDIGFNYKEWIYEAGIPTNALVIESNGFERIKLMAEDISKHKLNELENKFTLADRDSYSVQEWLNFLRTFLQIFLQKE